MEIVVNHLTRMRGGFVCVAGLGRNRLHVRPVLENGRLRKELVADYGGPFAIGAVVDLGETVPRPSAPEIEDHVFDPDLSRHVRVADESKLWGVLDDLAASSLTEIFGDVLVRDGRTASMPAGAGAASLGIYRPAGRPRLERGNGQLRMIVRDPELGKLSLPVTDLRLYDIEGDAVAPRRVDLLEDRLRRRDLLLAVGVSRAWQRDGDEPKHWLQVNNVHLDDNLFWPAAPA